VDQQKQQLVRKVLKSTLIALLAITPLLAEAAVIHRLATQPVTPIGQLPPEKCDYSYRPVVPDMSVESSARQWAVVDAARKRVTVYQEKGSYLTGFALWVGISVQECEYSTGAFYTLGFDNATMPITWAQTSDGEIGFSSKYVVFPPEYDYSYGFGVNDGGWVGFTVQVDLSKYYFACSDTNAGNAYEAGEFGIVGGRGWWDQHAGIPVYTDIWSLVVDFGGC
jgi:hypothetical protein